MNTTHKIQLAVAATALLGLTIIGGCTSVPPYQFQAQLAPEPPENLVFADTTQPVRDFDRSVAVIANGDTVAGSHGTRFQTREDTNRFLLPIVEPAVFVANAVMTPATLIEQRGAVVSSGVQIPPTHTAMPALPPSPAPVTQEPATPTDAVAPVPDGMSTIATTAPSTMPTDELTTPTVPAADVLLSTTNQPEAPAFSIAGQVLRAGSYVVTENLKLSTVVAAAGPSVEDPAKVSITIARANEEPATTTLAELLNGNVVDVAVQAGDTITVSVNP